MCHFYSHGIRPVMLFVHGAMLLHFAFSGQALPAEPSASPAPRDTRVEVHVVPRFDAYLKKDPLLMEGGAKGYGTPEGWIVIGVGLAPMEQGEGAARKAATRIADAAIAEKLFGAQVSVNETERNSVTTLNGDALFMEKIRSVTREEIQGVLRGVETVGSWYTRDKEDVAVVRAIGIPPLGGTALMDGNTGKGPDDTSGDTWHRSLLRQPALKNGGATLCGLNGVVYVLVVGIGKISVNDAEAVLAAQVAEMDALRTLIKYINGFRTRTLAETRMELDRIDHAGHEEILRDAVDSLRIQQENVKGMVRGLRAVDQWKSVEGDRLHIAYVVDLKDLLEIQLKQNRP